MTTYRMGGNEHSRSRIHLARSPSRARQVARAAPFPGGLQDFLQMAYHSPWHYIKHGIIRITILGKSETAADLMVFWEDRSETLFKLISWKEKM